MVEVTKETWKPVVGYEGLYEVSDIGRVKSLNKIVKRRFKGLRDGVMTIRERVLKPRSGTAGYQLVALFKNGVRTDYGVHYLVLSTFVGPRPNEKMEVRHYLDPDPRNNALTNLKWGTRKENAGDRKRHGRGSEVTNPKGEEIWWSKLTEKDIRKIKKLYASGKYYQQEIAKMYNIGQTLVSRIVLGGIWKHVK